MASLRTEVADRPRATSKATWFVRLAAGLVCLAAAAVIVFGLSLVLEDLSTEGEWFDGFGTFMGLLFCGLGFVLAVPTLFAAWLVRRQPFAAAMIICGIGLLMAVAGGLTLPSLGGIVSAPVLLCGVLVGGLGVGAALEARAVAITSPGGNTR